MPEDFFAQGFGQQQGPIFSKEENEFLEKKIVFLDPMKTYQISIGKVLALLKYTNLDNQTIKKIISNSCSNGIGQKIVTYEEMKKIFRGVALKQNKIEPSKINIQANIKTKMPIFYDDDQSEESQEQKPQPQKILPKQPQTQKPAVNTPQSHPVNQPPQPPKPQQQAPVNPLKAFDEYWKTLKTKNNLIDGSQVKKMFTGNNANKNNLSKAWKLCNISQKGVLTKGQFFIFMNLIHSPNIPEALTKQMKDIIKQIEQACGYKKATTAPSTQPSSQRSSSTSNPTQKRPSSDAFDKFGDESLFVKNDSKVQDLSKSGIIPKSTPNVFSAPSSTLASSSILSPPTSQNIAGSNKNALELLERVEHVGKQQKVREKQIGMISKNNQQMMEGLGSIEQYLNVVEENFSVTTARIEALKQTQNSLNQRLNNVCLKFKNIITKQSECIAFLMETMKVESEASSQRLEILQGYTEQMIQFVDSNMQMSKNQLTHLQKQQTHAYQGLKYQNEQLRDKLSAANQAPRSPQQIQKTTENISFKNSPQFGQHSRIDPFQDNQTEQHQEREGQNHGYEEQGNSSKSIERAQQNQQPTNHFSGQNGDSNARQQQGGHTFLQNLSVEERKKTKQMLLIQILNSVSSMNEEEYQAVVAKVVAMTEEQMNQSYTKLYALYMQNMAKSGLVPRCPVPSPEQFTAPYS